MSILTIAREHGVWTTEAGEVLARRLNAVLLTKEELERRLIDAGMTQKTFQRYDEKKPGFFSSLSSDMDLYILYLKTIMLEVAQESNVIILGRGAHLMLGNLPNCLRVRLVAPIEFRVETVKEEYGYDTDTASRIVRRCDADRSGFCFFHFNEQWADATKYDLTINTEPRKTKQRRRSSSQTSSWRRRSRPHSSSSRKSHWHSSMSPPTTMDTSPSPGRRPPSPLPTGHL